MNENLYEELEPTRRENHEYIDVIDDSGLDKHDLCSSYIAGISDTDSIKKRSYSFGKPTKDNTRRKWKFLTVFILGFITSASTLVPMSFVLRPNDTIAQRLISGSFFC